MAGNEINYNRVRHWNFRQVVNSCGGVNAAGEVVEIKQGEFNSQQAEQIASRLVLLAARIRNAAVSAEADFLITRD